MIVTVVWWVLAGIAASAEVLARTRPQWLSPLSRVGSYLARPWAGRLALWLAWIFLGVHFFARSGVEGH